MLIHTYSQTPLQEELTGHLQSPGSMSIVYDVLCLDLVWPKERWCSWRQMSSLKCRFIEQHSQTSLFSRHCTNHYDTSSTWTAASKLRSRTGYWFPNASASGRNEIDPLVRKMELSIAFGLYMQNGIPRVLCMASLVNNTLGNMEKLCNV